MYKSDTHTFNQESGSGLMTLDTTGLTIIGNCTITGTLQSPLTCLLGISNSVVDGKVGILGISNSELLMERLVH